MPGIATSSNVIPGLVPGIHVFLTFGPKTWMAGTSPAMTREVAMPSTTNKGI